MKPAHPSEVGHARARRDVAKLDKTEELLIPLRRGDGGAALVVTTMADVCFFS
jgi:hypothetical protein